MDAPPPYTENKEKQGFPDLAGPASGYAPTPGVTPYPPQQPTGYSAPYPPPGSQAPVVNTTIVQQPGQQYIVPPTATTVTVVRGGCPNCHSGVMTDNFTCCGICLGICFFPIGLICCFLMTEKRCSNCGATFN